MNVILSSCILMPSWLPCWTLVCWHFWILPCWHFDKISKKDKVYTYSVSILYGNIGIFRDLEAFLAPKSGGKPTNLQCTIGFCPWFWSRPPKLSWIKRIGFLTFIACHSKTNGCFQNFPAAFSSSVIELQQSSKQLFD